MGKKKANVAPEEENGEMDMSPMIDMVFLLLIFFVVNATAITVKKDKNIQMPTASSSGEVKSANGCIVVNVYGEGAGKRPPGVDPSVLWSSDVGTPAQFLRRTQGIYQEPCGTLQGQAGF